MVGPDCLLIWLHGTQLGGASLDFLNLALELGDLGLLGGAAVLEGASVFEGLLADCEDWARAGVALHELEHVVQCALVWS